MKLAVFTLYIAVLLGCSSVTGSNSGPVDPRGEIEANVRAYWHSFDPTLQPVSFSFHKIGDVYLVGTAFAGRDNMPSGKTVAQQFRDSNGVTTWRIEPFNDRWRSLLRVQE